MLCGIQWFVSRMVSTPTRIPMPPGCYMWFKTETATKVQHFCKLVQETKPYGSSGCAGKSREKSGTWTKDWKDNKVPDPSTNISVRCPFHCLEVFCMDAHMRTCGALLSTRTNTYLLVHMHIHTHKLKHAYILTHVSVHTRTYTHTRTHTLSLPLSLFQSVSCTITGTLNHTQTE